LPGLARILNFFLNYIDEGKCGFGITTIFHKANMKQILVKVPPNIELKVHSFHRKTKKELLQQLMLKLSYNKIHSKVSQQSSGQKKIFE
jgi:hypothetical protein